MRSNYALARLGDYVKVRRRTVSPRSGVEYRHYSLPAYDAGCMPETVEGSSILSSKLAVDDDVILMNKLNVRFKRVWPVRDAPENSVASTEFVPLVPSGMEYWYLYYSLLSPRVTSHLTEMCTGTSGSHQRVNVEDLLGLEIPLPNLDIQRQIASVLQAFDRKIELNNRLNGYLRMLAKLRFEEALQRGSRPVALGDIVVFEDSKRIPLSNQERSLRQGQYPYYGATSVMDHVDDYLFDDKRILVAEDGSVTDAEGRPIVQYVWGKYWVNNHAHVLKAINEWPLEEVMMALCRTSVQHIVTGAVQAKISQRNLKSLSLEMPQYRPKEPFLELFEQYRNLCTESSELALVRDALLPRLMSGEIDVSRVDITQLSNSH